MLVKFPVWEYHNTQLGFSFQINSNTKKDFRFAKIESPFLCSWSYYFTAPYKVSQSPVTPVIRGEWVVSHAWHEILRLSPHLFWLRLFTHRAFSSAQDDDTGERLVSRGGGFATFLEDGILAS